MLLLTVKNKKATADVECVMRILLLADFAELPEWSNMTSLIVQLAEELNNHLLRVMLLGL